MVLGKDHVDFDKLGHCVAICCHLLTFVDMFDIFHCWVLLQIALRGDAREFPKELRGAPQSNSQSSFPVSRAQVPCNQLVSLGKSDHDVMDITLW